MDRSGDRSLNAFDLNAVEQALRLQGRRRRRRGRARLDGREPRPGVDPQGPRHGRRPGAAGVRRRGGRLRPRGHELRARGGAGGRVAGPGALRPAGLRRRRRRAVGGGRRPPADAGGLPDLGARGRRRDRPPPSARPSSATTRSAPRCPRCSRWRTPSTSRATRRSRGSWAPRRSRRTRRRSPTSALDAGPRRRGRLAHHRHRPGRAAVARRHDQDRGRRIGARRRSSTSSWKGSSYEHPRLPGAPRLRASRRAPLGVLSKAAALDPDTSAVIIGSGVREHRRQRRQVRRREGLRGRRPRARGAPAAAARGRDQHARAGPGLRHGALRRVGARGRRRRRRLGPPRRRAQLGPGRPRRSDGGDLVGKRSALGDTVRADVGWTRRAEARPGPRRLLRRRSRTAARPPSRTWPCRLEDFSSQAVMVEQAHEEQTGPSIEDADILVTGGRGLGAPEGFALARGARRRAGRGRGLHPRGGGLGLVPLPDPDRPDRQGRLAEGLHRRSASRARSSTRWACRPRR